MNEDPISGKLWIPKIGIPQANSKKQTKKKTMDTKLYIKKAYTAMENYR